MKSDVGTHPTSGPRRSGRQPKLPRVVYGPNPVKPISSGNVPKASDICGMRVQRRDGQSTTRYWITNELEFILPKTLDEEALEQVLKYNVKVVKQLRSSEVKEKRDFFKDKRSHTKNFRPPSDNINMVHVTITDDSGNKEHHTFLLSDWKKMEPDESFLEPGSKESMRQDNSQVCEERAETTDTCMAPKSKIIGMRTKKNGSPIYIREDSTWSLKRNVSPEELTNSPVGSVKRLSPEELGKMRHTCKVKKLSSHKVLDPPDRVLIVHSIFKDEDGNMEHCLLLKSDWEKVNKAKKP